MTDPSNYKTLEELSLRWCSQHWQLAVHGTCCARKPFFLINRQDIYISKQTSFENIAFIALKTKISYKICTRHFSMQKLPSLTCSGNNDTTKWFSLYPTLLSLSLSPPNPGILHGAGKLVKEHYSCRKLGQTLTAHARALSCNGAYAPFCNVYNCAVPMKTKS